MIRVLIVEDEARIARHIEKVTREFLGPKLTFLQRCEDFRGAEKALAQATWDLLLLDLNLHGEKGFDLLKTCLTGGFHTIVISAYRECALEAFEYGVLDFVAKPFGRARLEKALSRLLQPERPNVERLKFLAVKTHRRIRLIPLAEIHFIQAAGHYSNVQVLDGSQILHDKSLDRLLDLLPSHFVRIHRSFIANLHFAKEIRLATGSQYELILEGEINLPIGRTRLKALRENMV